MVVCIADVDRAVSANGNAAGVGEARQRRRTVVTTPASRARDGGNQTGCRVNFPDPGGVLIGDQKVRPSRSALSSDDA